MAACSSCKKPIQNGTEDAKKATTWRVVRTGELAVECKVDGLKKPTEPCKLVGVRHYRCFKAEEKHIIRGGDPIRGRRMGNIPTAYEIAAMTANQDDLAFLGISEAEARKFNTRQLTEAVEHQREAMIARAAAIEHVPVEVMYAKVRQEAVRIAREKDKGHVDRDEAQWPASEPMELDVAGVPEPAEPTAIGSGAAES